MKKILFTGGILFLFISFTYCQEAAEIRKNVNAFLGTLKQEQLESMKFDFNDSSRTTWTNLPVGLVARPGLRYGDLSEESKIQFHHLLTTVFSSQGYLKIVSVMNLDDILNEVIKTAKEREEISEKRYQRMQDYHWGYNNYYISLWGDSESNDPWGFKFEGHHITVNFTVIGDEFSLTPLFFGTDPSEVHSTKYAGIRVLSKEEDYGFRLINSMSPQQQKIATLSTDVPRDIITNPKGPRSIDKMQGIRAGELTKDQRFYLNVLIMEYIGNLESEKSEEQMDKINDSGFENIYFAWIGSYKHQEAHYYIINGPNFMIEYDNLGNHIHSIWREKGNDFGEDLLREHFMTHEH